MDGEEEDARKIIRLSICVCRDSPTSFNGYKSFTVYTSSGIVDKIPALPSNLEFAFFFFLISIESAPFWKLVVGWMLFFVQVVFVFFGCSFH